VTDGVSTTTYAYNGDGDRVSQTVDSVETTYILDVATPLTMVLAETTGQDSIYYLHGLDLVAQSDGTTTDYLTYDGLGSVRQVLDGAGVPLLTQTFDPYGNLLARAGTGESSFGFTGEQTDENGLIYLRARYYAPGMGRFLNLDPSRQEMNPYRYSTGNPVSFVDPAGKLSQSIISLLLSSCTIPTTPTDGKGVAPYGLADDWDFIDNPVEALAGSDGIAIHPNDVNQAHSHDCYFAAVLASIAARKPYIIDDAIEPFQPDITPGWFTVTFKGLGYSTILAPMYPIYADGKRRYMTLDTAENDGHNQESWPLILENAWALYHGGGDLEIGYQRINAGTMLISTTFEALTGQPSTVAGTPTYEMIERHYNSGDLIVLKSLEHGEIAGIDEYDSEKIHPNHSYPVARIDSASREVIVRNVWDWDIWGEIPVAEDRLGIVFSHVITNPGY
jgi:RHS repeat-associated protein